jgi:murein DD-endopeptidase MepM/ murein hydrolase activator NlpD
MLAVVGAIVGAKHAGQAVTPVAVLLPPEVRHTAQVSAGIPLGVTVGPPAGSEEVALEQGASAQAEPVEPEAVAYTVHEVAAGETLSGVGAQYGVDVQYLLWNNPEVGADPNMLVEGENLLVPGTPGIVYDVKLGDTVTDIAATYSIEPAEIVAFTPNGLDSPDMIVEGSVLVLPGAVPPPPPPPPEVPQETPAPVTPEPVTPEPTAPPPAAPAPRAPLPIAVATPAPAPPPAIETVEVSGFIWPVNGSLNSRFGPRWGSFHSGIDIGAAGGTSVAAAASGKVVLASYSNYGYGNYVIVRHGNGSETLYAHLSRIYVSMGQQVGQGETIGTVGCTGWCTGPHLHFEVKVGGVAVDPLPYLP